MRITTSFGYHSNPGSLRLNSSSPLPHFGADIPSNTHSLTKSQRKNKRRNERKKAKRQENIIQDTSTATPNKISITSESASKNTSKSSSIYLSDDGSDHSSNSDRSYETATSFLSNHTVDTANFIRKVLSFTRLYSGSSGVSDALNIHSKSDFYEKLESLKEKDKNFDIPPASATSDPENEWSMGKYEKKKLKKQQRVGQSSDRKRFLSEVRLWRKLLTSLRHCKAGGKYYAAKIMDGLKELNNISDSDKAAFTIDESKLVNRAGEIGQSILLAKSAYEKDPDLRTKSRYADALAAGSPSEQVQALSYYKDIANQSKNLNNINNQYLEFVAHAHWRLLEFNEGNANMHARTALQIIEKMPKTLERKNYLMAKALSWKEAQSDSKEAEQELSDALAYLNASTIKDAYMESRMLSRLAKRYRENGNPPEETFRLLEASLDACKKIPDDPSTLKQKNVQRGFILIEMAKLMNTAPFNDISKAREYLKSGRTYSQAGEHKENTAFANYLLGIFEPDPQAGIPYRQAALAYYEENPAFIDERVKTMLGLGKAYASLAIAEKDQNSKREHNKNSIKYYDKIIQLYNTDPNSVSLKDVVLTLMEYGFSEKSSRIQKHRQAVEYAKRTGDLDLIKRSQETLAQSHLQKGNFHYSEGKTTLARAQWEAVLKLEYANEEKKKSALRCLKDRK